LILPVVDYSAYDLLVDGFQGVEQAVYRTSVNGWILSLPYKSCED